MGLGSAETVTAEEARDAAEAARKLAIAGIGPVEHRKAEKALLDGREKDEGEEAA